MSQSVRIGFIGLGSIGKPMAVNLARSALPLTVWARRPEVMESFQAEVRRARTPAEVGSHSDFVSVVVFDDVAVEEVIFGTDGLVQGLSPGAVVLVHSTVPPEFIIDVAQRAKEFGIDVLDAPVSGGPDGAELGQLTIMAGGEASVVARVRPLTDILASSVIHLGGLGAGQGTKLLNNAIFTAHLALTDSVAQLAIELEIEPAALMQAISASSGRSFALDMYRNSGTVAKIAAGAARPALTKDVGILRSLVATDPLVLQVAETFVKAMAQAADSRNDGVK